MGKRRSPLTDHPQCAEIMLMIRQCIIENRTGGYIRQKLIAAPPDGYGMTGPDGRPISVPTVYNWMRFVEGMMARAEEKTNKAERMARHIATLRHTISLGYDEHDAGRARYGELAKAVHDLVQLQARIDGTLNPTPVEGTVNSMYVSPPAHLVAVLEAATAAQEQLSEDE